jgi:type I restriction enzyme S subunit
LAIKDSAGIGCLDLEISGIPEDWETVKLKEIISLEYGKGLSERNRERGLFPVVGSNGVVGFHNLALVKGPGIVVGRKGTIGAVSLIKLDFWPIDTTYYIRILNKEISLKWLFFALVKLNLPKLSMSDVVPGLKRELVYNLKLLIPPLPEQKKIAEIISTVDQGIEKVDEAIKKTQRLKNGLMQELLTKGIGHKEFKDTETCGERSRTIGKIPKEWEVVSLRDTVEEIKNGFASGKRDEDGITQIRMNNVTTDGRLIFDSYLKVPIPENLDEWLLRKGDFLFNNTNSYDLVGKSTVFKDAPFYCTFSNHFTRIRFNKRLVLPELILYHFLILWQKGYFKSVAIRHVGQSAVHTDYLLRLQIPLPPLQEQQRIAEILSTVDGRLDLFRKRKERLERTKKGLMNDLLTGRKRVRLEA